MKLVPLVLLAATLFAASARAQDTPDLLLEVRLGRHVISDGVGAYQQGSDVLLPLGEMARLLTLAIKADAAAGQASGYILDEQRSFHLDLARQLVIQGPRHMPFDAALVRRGADDLYVPSRLLASWLPVDFAVDMSTLLLTVSAREKLPLQARFERRERPNGQAAEGSGEAYPLVATPYRMLRAPFVDQTLDLDLRGKSERSTYTAYATGDLLGAQAALYYRSGHDPRLTLARHDPGARLLGPLQARTAQAGSMASPGIANITPGSAFGNGVLVSNRALGQPGRFDRHNLQGDLPPGWDVELYFNGALTGFQQSRPDGRYAFDDLPLIYGANEFRLVFHGPLGQVKIERHTFLLEQSMLAAGQFEYHLASQRDERGGTRTSAQFDYGLHRRLTVGGALARIPHDGGPRTYTQLGAQAYLDNVIVSASLARDGADGALAQLAVKTRIGMLALAGSHARLNGFESELYPALGDPVAARSEVRLDGQLGKLPVTLHARRDTLVSSAHNAELNARVSAYRYGTAMSGALRWLSLAGGAQADALLQATRRVAGIGISGQLQYTIRPHPGVATLAISADKHLNDGYLVSLGVARSFIDPEYRFTAGLTKSLGRWGMGLSAFYASRTSYGLGLQLFTAIGREPHQGRWMLDAAPMAASGSAAARVFVDQNNDGVMNAGEAPIAGAGFLVNGGTQLARTGADGVAWLGRLAPHQYADIALDPATLEDPQWQPRVKGMRIVPRPGTVSTLDFAVGLASEIDGTAWLVAGTGRRGAGDLEVELLDGAARVVASTRTGADGYYILPAIAPGRYLLRVAPAQLARLGLAAPAPHSIEIGPDAAYVNGKDFLLDPALLVAKKR